MEYNFSKHSVSYPSRFLDTVNEQIVDVDVTLPDYCPDIEKILKCTLVPKIYTRSISGGQLTVDGESVVQILYCDSIKNHIRSFCQTVPFTATFGLKSTPEQYVILCDTKCEYINCRALSPRKLVVHGAFSLCAKVLSKGVNDFYCFDTDCDLKTKEKELIVSDLTCMCQEQFSLTEDITISSKPPVQSLLTYDVTSNITELKCIHNKIMLNAELTLKLMYLSDLDSGAVEHISYAFPVNRIFDCEGMSDDVVAVPMLEVMSSDLHIRNDNLNDGSMLALDTKLCFSSLGFFKKYLKVVDDVYSIKYLTEHKRSSVCCETNHSFENLTHIIKSQVFLESMKISKVIDIYSQGVSMTPVVSENELTLSGKVNLCMLISDDDNKPVYVERSVEIEFKPQFDRIFDKAQLCGAKVNSISYRLVDECTLELRIEIKADVLLSDVLCENPVVSVVSLEDKPIDNSDCSLVLYFADSGENTWDIAKMYATDENQLIEENSLNDSYIHSPQMLLVPKQ